MTSAPEIAVEVSHGKRRLQAQQRVPRKRWLLRYDQNHVGVVVGHRVGGEQVAEEDTHHAEAARVAAHLRKGVRITQAKGRGGRRCVAEKETVHPYRSSDGHGEVG